MKLSSVLSTLLDNAGVSRFWTICPGLSSRVWNLRDNRQSLPCLVDLTFWQWNFRYFVLFELLFLLLISNVSSQTPVYHIWEWTWRNDRRSEGNLCNCVKKPGKKKFRTSTGFEPVTSRLPVRCSANWAMKPLTLGAGQLWVHMFPWKKWVLMIYEIYHIWTVEMKWKWSNDRRSQRNLCNCIKKSEKKREVNQSDQMLQFQQHLFYVFFVSSMTSCAMHYDIIYYPFPINSQHLKMCWVDSPESCICDWHFWSASMSPTCMWKLTIIGSLPLS